MSQKLLEAVARSALTGARDALAHDFEFDSGEPIVVVTVAWKDGGGNPFVVASAIPDDHGHDLLSESLRQSAEEAES